jgi:hypothetical protein
MRPSQKDSTMIKCEKCQNSDTCNDNPKLCKNFTVSIDSNYKYLLEPELLQQEKTNNYFALCL